MLAKHIETNPEPPSRRSQGHIPPARDALILACLEKNPAQRPDAATLAGQLAAYAAQDAWTEAQARDWWQEHLPPSGPGAEQVA